MVTDSGQQAFILGTWSLGSQGWTAISASDAQATLERAWELGIREFDTAYGYGDGEKRLGKFLRQLRREEYTVASKAFPGKNVETFKRQYEESRERLGVEKLDTFFIHWPHPEIDPRPRMEFLETERAEGRLRKIGVSNYQPRDLDAVREVGTVDVYQGGYHLLWRQPEQAIVPYCREAGIGMQAYSPLGQGILTGKFPRHPEFPKEDNRSRTVLFEEEVWPEVYGAVEELKALAERAGVSLIGLALQWIVHRNVFDKMVVGARRPDQIADSWEAFNRPIAESVLEEATAISDRLQKRIPAVTNFWRNSL